MRRTAILFLTLLVGGSAFAQPQPQHIALAGVDTISVSGTAKLRIRPDQITFSIGVETVAPTVTEAVRENNRKVSAVIAALKRGGAEDRNLQTSNLSIYPRQEYREGQQPRILGYQVTNTITVTTREVEQAGTLLQVAIDAGANVASGLSFVVSNPAQAEAEGLRRAYQDALAKAQALAAEAGRSVGRAVAIAEGGMVEPPRPMYRTMDMAAESSVGQVPVEPGTQELEFRVSVVFEMK